MIQITYPFPDIAQLSMNDAENRNAFTPDFIDSLLDAIQTITEHPTLKVVIFSGLSDVFSSGAPAEMLRHLADKAFKPADIVLPKYLLDIPIPVIAAMEGHAVGGGLALGLCADMVILSKESRYGCSFMNMGFTPGMGMTSLLECYMSKAMAHEWMYTGTYKKGRDLVGITGFNYILPKGDVQPKAMELAQILAKKPRTALMWLKRHLSVSKKINYEISRSNEASMHDLSFSQPDIQQYIEDNYLG